MRETHTHTDLIHTHTRTAIHTHTYTYTHATYNNSHIERSYVYIIQETRVSVVKEAIYT